MQEIGLKLQSSTADIPSLLTEAEDKLRAVGFTPDELFIRDAQTLAPLTATSGTAVILMAAWLGQTRLIDNLSVSLPPQID